MRLFGLAEKLVSEIMIGLTWQHFDLWDRCARINMAILQSLLQLLVDCCDYQSTGVAHRHFYGRFSILQRSVRENEGLALDGKIFGLECSTAAAA